MKKEHLGSKMRRELSLTAAMYGVPLSILIALLGELYLHASIVIVSSIYIMPWKNIWLMAYYNYLYGLSFVSLLGVGTLGSLFYRGELFPIYMIVYVVLVFIWSFYSERVYQAMILNPLNKKAR